MEYLRELTSWQIDGRTLILDGGWQGQIMLTPALPGVVQVRLRRGTPWSKEESAQSLSVDPAAWPELAAPEVVDRGEYLLAFCPGVTVRIDKKPLRLHYWQSAVEETAAGAAREVGMAGAWVTVAGQAEEHLTAGGGPAVAQARLEEPDGAPLLSEAPEGGLWMDGWDVGARWALDPADSFFGLGTPDQRQGAIPFNHRGREYPVWHKHLPAPSRMVLPVLVSHRGYGLFIDNPWIARWDLGADGRTFSYTAQGGQLVYYFIAGPALTTVLDRYTRLTGRPALAPKWAFGLLQSKFGYKTRAEVEALVDTFDQKGIPLDCVILDLYWFKKMGDLAFDRANFPDPAGMIAGLKARGVKVIVIEEPFLVKESRLYPEAERLGLMGKRADGSAYAFRFWAGEAGLMDFTQPLARQWWADQHKPLMDLGIAGWWTDLNEPEEQPVDMLFAGGPAMATRNNYALQMVRAIHTAQQQHQPDDRLFILSRSGWPGIQALGAGQWSGDVATRWDALANQIPIGLSMAMAGMAYWNTDVGGFAGERPMPDLYVRWVQFGAFTPILRPHGAHQEREPWAFGPDHEEIAVRYINLRYRLLPYNYGLAREAAAAGLPFMRPLVLHYPEDRNTVNLVDQYLWGRDLLVAPVVTPDTTERKVYLPAGEWYDFWTNKKVRGGKSVRAAAPLEIMPLFVRAGAIIPMAPERTRTGGAWEELTLAVYPGADSTTYELYEDDGESRAFERGAFATTIFTAESAGNGLVVTIGATTGTFAGQAAERSYRVEARLPKRPRTVQVEGAALTARRSLEGLNRADTGWWYDQKRKVLHVKLGVTAGEARLTIE